MGEGNEVAVRQAGQVSAMPDAREITALYKMGQALSQSGMFPDARQTFQAMTKLVLGRDLGLSATAAMTGIYIVEGKPELSANLQAQMIRTWLGLGGERYDYDVEGPTEEACAVTIYRVNPGVTYGDKENYQFLGRSEFTVADAQRAGLIKADKPKSAWNAHRRNMLFARAISNAVAFFCPEVTGGVRIYAPGEIGDREDPGMPVTDVGGFQERAEALEAQEQAEQPEEEGIQDAHVVEDSPLTPEQQAEQDRLDAEYGATLPEFEEVQPAAEEPAPEPAPEAPTHEQIDAMIALVQQGLMELGESEPTIQARLRGAKRNPTALQNLLKFIDNKKQQQEASNG